MYLVFQSYGWALGYSSCISAAGWNLNGTIYCVDACKSKRIQQPLCKSGVSSAMNYLSIAQKKKKEKKEEEESSSVLKLLFCASKKKSSLERIV